MSTCLEVTIEKQLSDGSTAVLIRTIDPDNREAEIADMRRELDAMVEQVKDAE